MPHDLLEQMYCSQQINIPPNLPFILKQYAKAAIRTQPHDLLYWSAAYFRAKADNTPPPVKERLEYPPTSSPSRLSPGFLKVLHKQLGDSEEVPAEVLYNKWLGVCLVKEALDTILKIGGMGPTVQWLQFVAIAAGHLCPSLSKTMATVCEVLTEEPDGGSAMIPVDVFVTLYQYLARLDCGPNDPNKGLTVDSNTTLTSIQESQNTEQSGSLNLVLSKDTKEVIEKDSRAGLMVWEDLKPSEKEDTLRSPHYKDELGASSELGIEVLDDAKGTVQEVLTLYSVQDEITSEVSLPPSHPISSNDIPDIDKNILSHSSLKENDDWIKIEPRKFYDEIPAIETLIEPLKKSDDKQENEGTEETDGTKNIDSNELMSSEQLAEKTEPPEEESPKKIPLEPFAESNESPEKETPDKIPSEPLPESNEASEKETPDKIPSEPFAESNEAPEKETADKIPSEPFAESNEAPEKETPDKIPSEPFAESNEAPEKETPDKIPSEPLVESNKAPDEEKSNEILSENLKERKEPSEEKLINKNIESQELIVKSVDDEKETSPHKEKYVSFDDPTHLSTEFKSTEDYTKLPDESDASAVDITQTHKELLVTDSLIKGTESATGSVFGLGESVTIEQFVRDDLDKSTVTYSTGEIRKGVFGHQPHEEIERDSSERIIKAAETVHQLATVEDKSSVLLPAVKSTSDNFSSQESCSFLVIEEFWQEVPGIGPVIPEPQILAVVEYMQYWATKQEGMVMPRNINHILCPPLDPLPTNDDKDAESHY